MIDLDRVFQGLGGLLQGQNPVEHLDPAALLGQLTANGIDPSALAGMAPDQIFELLQQHGIDLSALAPEQLQEIIGQLGSFNDFGR